MFIFDEEKQMSRKKKTIRAYVVKILKKMVNELKN